ncbi:unnamed protein product [Diatraea saccharalis]|uniref:Uncharacterized protein n=1 Tax=Diatraea saccharalis TaxID=40085 RepID=A0A9N9N4V1_9NEOP|nr:unnamed protein product [Diatraea saccharalis]
MLRVMAYALTHWYTVAASLHRATIGVFNGNTEMSTCTTRGGAGAASARACTEASRRYQRRDERSHGPAPTHDSLRRNDEAAGHARAPCDIYPPRHSPTPREITRRGGEQTHSTSPSNTVMRLRIQTFPWHFTVRSP